MIAARIPGLILPLASFVALAAGAIWYWRNRGE